LSAAAIESAIGAVGRPVRRERVPSVPASSPFAIDWSTSARISGNGAGSPAPLRMPVKASTETGL
jgi:hypothetical protein